MCCLHELCSHSHRLSQRRNKFLATRNAEVLQELRDKHARLVTVELALERVENSLLGSERAKAKSKSRRKKAKGDQNLEHESPNKLGLIENAILKHHNTLLHKYASGGKKDLCPAGYCWAFVFKMPGDNNEELDIDISSGVDIDFDLLMQARGEIKVSHEAWMFCERCWASDLDVTHTMALDGKSIIISIGAPYQKFI